MVFGKVFHLQLVCIYNTGLTIILFFISKIAPGYEAANRILGTNAENIDVPKTAMSTELPHIKYAILQYFNMGQDFCIAKFSVVDSGGAKPGQFLL